MFTVYKHHKVFFVIEIVSMSSVLQLGNSTQFRLLRRHK